MLSCFILFAELHYKINTKLTLCEKKYQVKSNKKTANQVQTFALSKAKGHEYQVKPAEIGYTILELKRLFKTG